MPGERELSALLAEITVDRRPGSYCFVGAADELKPHAEATVWEPEGTSVVLPVEKAEAHGHSPDFVAAWLTVRIHSALDAVGLTALIAKALTDANIPCNVVAGYFHDHLLVPVGRAHDAILAIEALRAGAGDA